MALIRAGHQDIPGPPPSTMARPTGTVVVSLAGLDGREARSLCADLDSGTRTFIADDPDTLRRFRDLELSIRRNGVESGTDAVTAGTLAALGEAARVSPREERWAGDAGPQGERLRLPRPNERLSMPLEEVLRNRRSIRAFAPIDATRLSTLLYHSARIRVTWQGPGEYPASSRAAPSAGARHPLDLVVIPGEIEGMEKPRLDRGSPYLFDPMTCELVSIDDPWGDAFRESLSHAKGLLGATPAVVLVLAARMDRTFSRYRGGISLIYRDAGALLATIGLVASALGLSCCTVATAIPPSATLDPSLGWVEVGGVALGGMNPSVA